MNPDHLDWVELSDHAKEGLADLGLPASLAIGRIHNLHGRCYEDGERGGYNLYCPGLGDVVFAFVVEYDAAHRSKTAVVRTVFQASSPEHRFTSDRFDRWDS